MTPAQLATLLAVETLAAYRAALDDATLRFPLGKYDESKLYQSAQTVTAGTLFGELRFALFENFYGEYLDRGRPIGIKKVPINALLAWIKAKRIAPRPGQTELGLAFAIQTGIFKRGIEGRKYRAPAFDGAVLLMDATLEKTLLTVLTKDLTEALA